MLAHVLQEMLVALSRVKALPYVQADHDGVRLEAHIPLTFPMDHRLVRR